MQIPEYLNFNRIQQGMNLLVDYETGKLEINGKSLHVFVDEDKINNYLSPNKRLLLESYGWQDYGHIWIYDLLTEFSS